MPYAFSDAQRAALLEKWPHLSPSQLGVLAERLADKGEAVAKATSPEDTTYFLEWCHVRKDASLIRQAPTPQQYVEHRMAEAKANGRDVTGADKMTAFREAQEMDADALLAAVPADSASLKASTIEAKKAAVSAYNPDDQNALVRAFAEESGRDLPRVA